ncbi:hypothetical protein [Rugamonas sp.]|uniref:hypothetical protein n=1 Tax=Rugamonas sp. TaxID=1926287 RepID=UPI0025E55481|nr:hypothetical protein [Rugamonas sp.]
MSTKPMPNPLTVENFHAVDAYTCKQTMAESRLEYSIDMGGFTLHHGTRHGAPIIIAEHLNQKADELSGIWFDGGQ